MDAQLNVHSDDAEQQGLLIDSLSALKSVGYTPSEIVVLSLVFIRRCEPRAPARLDLDNLCARCGESA